MDRKIVDLIPTNIKSENDSLKHSLHQAQQNLSSRTTPPPRKDMNEQPETHNKRRVRRRASEPINVPSPPKSTSLEGGFLYGREMQTWDDSMVTTSYHTKRSVSFSIEMQHSYYSPSRQTLSPITMSPQTGHLRNLPNEELAGRRGSLVPKETLFAEEDSMKRVYMEKDRMGYKETIGFVNEHKDFVQRRPDTPMTTLLMRITEL